MSIVHHRIVARVVRRAREVGLKCVVVVAAFVVGVEVITAAVLNVVANVVQDTVVIMVVVSAAVDEEVIVVVVAVAASGCWFVKIIRNIMTHMVQNAIIGKDSLLRNVLPLFVLHPLHSLLQRLTNLKLLVQLQQRSLGNLSQPLK